MIGAAIDAPLVHHVTLTVTDPRRSADWYQRLLGPASEIVRECPTWTRIRMQWPSGLVIGVTTHEATTDVSFNEARVDLDHVGLGCRDESEVRQWHDRLNALDVDHGPLEVVPYGWAVTARDPDGIALEFFCATSP